MKRKANRTAKPARAKGRAKKSVTAKPRRSSRGSAAAQPDAIDLLVTAGAQALGLALDPAWQGSVKFNLQLILRHAALVDEFPLLEDAEPAPVFHA
jgi:hypothetical protein